MVLDYERLGLKVGLEIHRQLNTARKLFCPCPTEYDESGEKISFTRFLREAQSELGELDPAAVFESRKRKKIVYRMDRRSACLVELDEEPPHTLNGEAVEIALTAALLMGSTPVDEIHVMRKIVVDGSNTAGFQRTCVVATGGRVVVDGEAIPIQTITLEEDAARLVESSRGVVEYDLSRLGIPLIEVATAPVIKSPEQAVKAAKAIGDILRATGKVKRGLGTVRQDLNISIRDGALVEVKGVQELELIDDVVEYEVRRQLHLLDVSKRLAARLGGGLPAFNPVDVTHLFTDTKSKVIRRSLDAGGRVMALLLPAFAGLISEEPFKGVRLGAELAAYAKAWAEVEGIFHTDELPGYGITSEEVASLRKYMGAGDADAVVLVADLEHYAVEALRAVYERAAEALRGVPNETRAARQDGSTVYIRPRPGAARMYPETDIPPIPITENYLEELKSRLPETLDRLAERLSRQYGLSRQLVQELIDRERVEIFMEILGKTSASPTVVATTLTETLTSLARDGVDVGRLGERVLLEVFQLLSEGVFSKEMLRDVLARAASEGVSDVRSLVSSMGLAAVDLEEVRRYVDELVERNRSFLGDERAVKRLMGDLMKRYRGRVDGRLLHQILSERVAARTGAAQG
ncbi:Aspartyl/glutamyl-tRNA(Asn/Gln) amidotransferase subunit B [archaeon HR01]|nr:Aspartyl/glutamyl-tRNA(Asn/Gln) amidotransferase subunit B [archaeon HR01]